MVAPSRDGGRTWRLDGSLVLSRPDDEILDARYPARRLLGLIGDKWTPIVLYRLSQRNGGFNALQRRLPGISKKVLTQMLRSLEQDGLVERTVHATVPPRTEYGSTGQGRKLHEPVAAL